MGRGAMGVTYKALDVDLHCLVTLKVINEKYLDDEATRLRFLHEARAAASLRHPNVASVFHLGRAGKDYFYAMEFVEGETLERLIKRSGPLELKTALEITTQVSAGFTPEPGPTRFRSADFPLRGVRFLGGRYNSCLGRCREVSSCQPLAPRYGF